MTPSARQIGSRVIALSFEDAGEELKGFLIVAGIGLAIGIAGRIAAGADQKHAEQLDDKTCVSTGSSNTRRPAIDAFSASLEKTDKNDGVQEHMANGRWLMARTEDIVREAS